MIFPYVRLMIENTFNCRIISEYGSTENGVLAFECEYRNLHVLWQNIYLESIDEKGNPVYDDIGRIIVTELHSRSIPFIRYEIGDYGILKKINCLCKNPAPVLVELAGRIDNFILIPDGGKVYDAILAYCLKENVYAFRGLQRRRDEIIIEIVPEGKLEEKNIAKYEKKLRKHLGNKIKIEFIEVKNIPKDKNGKLRYFISEI